jgi:hypothetical protein
MSDGPEWFAPKRYGYGSGRPISWQGWALTALFFVAVAGLTIAFKTRPSKLVAALAPLLAIYMVISAKTTRGGWRWRWGDQD